LNSKNPKTYLNPAWYSLLVTLLLSGGVFALTAGLLAAQNTTGSILPTALTSALAVDSVHMWWYVSRAAGLMAYLLFWLSTVWGFGVASKIFDPLLDRTFTYDFHEQISLLSLAFTSLHAFILLIEKVEPLSLVEVLVPFASAYRPLWVGAGVISFYLAILVSVTFYLRSRISMQAFRKLHYLSVFSYVAALAHSLYSGTDSSILWVQVMYWGTCAAALFFLLHWLMSLFLVKSRA